MNQSERVANTILGKVMLTLQDAEELNGPDSPEYIRMMEKLAQICAARAETCRLNLPEQRVLRWVRTNVHKDACIEDTGGGCTALQIPASSHCGPTRDYWWLTDDAATPDRMRADDGADPFWLCLYKGDGSGEKWIAFAVRSVEEAARIIRAHNGSAW